MKRMKNNKSTFHLEDRMNRFDSTFSSTQRSTPSWLRFAVLAVLVTVGLTSFAHAQTTINRASPAGNVNQACEGQQIVYNTENFGTSGQTYTWTVVGGFVVQGAGTPSVTVQWQNVGNQTLTISRNSFGTVTTATINVAVSRTPTPAIAGSNVVCINAERTYTTLGVAGSNYTWNVSPSSMCAVIGGVPLGVASGSNQVNLRWINTGTATVSVTETAVGGVCSATTTASVIVNPIPAPNPQSSTGYGSPTTRRPGIVAAGTVHTYSVAATPGNVFLWTITGGTITSGTASSSTITVNWPAAGTGVVRCRETVPGSDCSTERIDTVLIRPVPQPNITSGGNPIVSSPCSGSIQTYSTASVAGNTYNWTVGGGGSILSGQGTPTVTVLWSGTTWPNVITSSISVTESIADALPLGQIGTTANQQTISVAIKPNPLATTITGSASVCATNLSNTPPTVNNATYTCTVPANTGTGFTGSGTLTPTWSVTGGTIVSGQGTATITVQWNNTGTTPVTGTVTCVHTSSFNCTSTSTFSVTVNPLTTPSVSGPATLCVNSNAEYSVAAATDNVFTWAISPNGIITSGQGTNILRVRWLGSGTGTVSCTQISPIFGCPVTNTRTITINPLPTASLTVSGKTSFCEGGDITICAPLGFNRYVWSTGETSRCIVARVSGPYWCLVTNGNGCTASSDTVRLNVTAAPAPTVAISGPTNFCEGGSVVLTAPAGFGSYVWTSDDAAFRATTPSITVTKGGLYRVSVVNPATGCSGMSAETEVVVNPTPKPTLAVTGNANFCAGDSVVVTAPSGYLSYAWVSSSGNSYGTSNRIVLRSTDTVRCVVVDVNGCTGSSDPVGVKTPPLVKPVVISNGPTTFCTGSAVTLTAEDGFTTYLWSNGSTSREIKITESGEYFVTVLDKATQCPVSSAIVKVDVNDPPVKPIVSRVGDVLTAASSSNVEAWAWNYNGTRIQNAMSSSYTVTSPGTYSAVAIRKNCESTSEDFEIVFTGVHEDVVAGAANFTVFPNPTNGRVSISTGLALNGDVRINITNAVGVSVMSVSEVASGAGFTSSFDMTSLPAGLYNVVITNGSERWVVSLIRQ
jgi:hypothetical protein